MTEPAKTMTEDADVGGMRAPSHVGVRDALAARIAAREWPPGTALPSQKRLAAAYGVPLRVLRRAVDLLVADGVLRLRQGSGSFVSHPPDQPPPPGMIGAGLGPRFPA